VPVPWGVLVSALPTLIDSAGKLIRKSQAPARLPEVSGSVEQQLDALARRLAYYESLEAEQARLVQQAVAQLEQLTLKAKAAERRANIALALAAVSTVVAGLAMFLR
jgi:beta-phosphoglucomutase-like phosphatase (HAD superfamily)